MFPILSEDFDIIQILNKLYSTFILRLAFYFILSYHTLLRVQS